MVTAERRKQSMQDVPISIMALGRENLEARGIDELDDLGANIPNLYVNNFSNDPVAVRMFIRGIGQNDLQLTQDPSVALYLDGVYIGTSFGAGFEGVDIERIEVLRGPQGTLYGRNATGGAINLITQRASTEGLEFRQMFQLGNLGLFKTRTFLNVPVSDKLAFKLGYIATNRDGYVDNRGVGEDFGTEDRRSAVIDLRYKATDALTFDYRYENANIEDSGRLEQAVSQSDSFLVTAGLVTPGTVSKNRQDKLTSLWPIEAADVEIEAHTLNMSWDLNDTITLNSITAWRDLDSFTSAVVLPDWRSNLVPGGGSISDGINDIQFEQFSQELQLFGSWSQLEFAGGLYFYKDEGTHDGGASTVVGLPPPEFDITETENDSLAAYAQATWTPSSLDSRWHFTLGARYSDDNRKAFRRNTRSADFAASAPDGANYDNDFSNFNPSFTVAYDVNDYTNVYAKVVTGFKSGGTSTRSSSAVLFQSGFDEEEILSYEIGFKGDFWDRRVRFNAAAFYMEIDGLQASVQTGGSPGERDFLPIDDNEILGFEADLTVALSEEWQASVNYGYLDTELGEDQLVTPAGVFDLIGEMSYAPKQSLTVALDYHHSVRNGELHGRLGYAYQEGSNSSVNVADNFLVDDRNLIDASISWSKIHLGDVSGVFRVMLWGKNLTDEEYTIISVASWKPLGAAQVSTFGEPRTYGVSLSYDY